MELVRKRRAPNRYDGRYKPRLVRDKAWFQQRYGLSHKVTKSLTIAVIDQLDACADDPARRLLLGVSQKFAVRRLPVRPEIMRGIIEWRRQA